MRIGIDARMYGPKQGGLGRYIEQLLLNLELINPSGEFYVFLRKDNWSDYEPKNPNFKKVLADIPWYGIDEQIKFHPILLSYNLDLMHFPHWNVPIFYNRKFIVTIHDLLLLKYPTRRASTLGPIAYSIKNFAFKQVLKNASQKSERIITVSNFSKNDIINLLEVPDEKIKVTHLAPLEKKVISKIPEIDNRITKPFALYVGVAYPHKNLDRLIDAWQLLLKNDFPYQLVLCGKKNYFYEQLIKKYEPVFLENKVVFTDYLSDEELVYLYSRASLYVFPSLYEGFGLPPLEAMQYGIPVASSNSSCLPEILQGAALYFDPQKISEIASTIESALANEKLRKELKKLGYYLIEKYNWIDTAKATWEIYKNSV